MIDYYTFKGSYLDNRYPQIRGAMSAPDHIYDKYVESVSAYSQSATGGSLILLANGVTAPTLYTVRAQMRSSGLSPSINGRKFYLNMGVASGSFVWGCDGNSGAANIQGASLPNVCTDPVR